MDTRDVEQLLLPAPVELFVIPGVNAIPQTLAGARELAPLPVSHAEARSISEST